MQIPKPVFKKDRVKWKKRAIAEAKRQVREEHRKCQCCGHEGRQLHGAHIIPVDFEGTAADKDNILCLCSRCHGHDKNSCHKNPVWFVAWLDEFFPERKDRMWEKARPCTKYDAIKWKEIYDDLIGGSK